MASIHPTHHTSPACNIRRSRGIVVRHATASQMNIDGWEMFVAILTCHARVQELGGRILPAVRGAYSARFLEQLRDEALAPLWPDPEDLSTLDASDAMPARYTRTTVSMLERGQSCLSDASVRSPIAISAAHGCLSRVSKACVQYGEDCLCLVCSLRHQNRRRKGVARDAHWDMPTKF